MWLFTTRGFYSVVQDTSDPEGETLLVRSRTRQDLEALREFLPAIEIRETPEHDYRFRVRLPRQVFGVIALNLVSEIDYPNFKNAVAERQSHERAGIYGDVWVDVLALQRERG